MSTPRVLSRTAVRLCVLMLGMLVAACGSDLAAPAKNGLMPSFSHETGHVGHHTVTYLGTETGGIHKARWAVTELGCETTATSSGKGSGGGKGGTNCNSMSHIAFGDFVGSISNLRPADETSDAPFSNGGVYTTPADAAECDNSTFVCRTTGYGYYYGASKPDGLGNWIKYSTINGTTVQLAQGFTHIFTVRFVCAGALQHGTVTAAIKSGNTVVTGAVPGPRCS